MRAVKFLFIFVAILFAGLQAQQVCAQDYPGIVLENVAAQINFGEQINFVATIKSPVPAGPVSIVITDEYQGVMHAEPLTIQEGGHTEFRYDTRQNDLRPFSPVSWKYRFTLQDGSMVESEVYSTRYEDNRFNWQSLESGRLRVHWYDGGQDFGQAAMNAAEAGMEVISSLVPANLDQPVEIYIYSNLNDLRGTLAPGSQEWIAGHTDPSLGVVMVAIEPGLTQTMTLQQRLPHELMHVMFYRALSAGYLNIPTWLGEGMAGLAEPASNPGYDLALMQAAARQDWIPLRSLCEFFPNEMDRALLAYAESRSFARYLQQSYGPASLLALANTYAGGAACETGPELAFGVPLSKLEQDWHASMAGQEAMLPALQSMAPYLVLLCLILFVPLTGMVSAMRSRRNRHDSETQ